MTSYVKEEMQLIVSSDSNAGAKNVSPDGSRFEVLLDDPITLPQTAENVKVSVQSATVWWTSPNLITGENDLIYIFGDDVSTASPQVWAVTIPQGLYDLNALNTSIQSGLEALGARTLGSTGDTLPLISIAGDSSTQKVLLRTNYDNVYVDFTQSQTFREILGFDSAIYGPYVVSPLNTLAPNVASFNTIEHFLIGSDLVSQGIRFNNSYNQIISQVLIDVSPGSQIVSTPFNPPKVRGDNLVNTKKSILRFWLTDQSGRPVNTNGENWGCRLVISYQVPVGK